MNLGVPGRHDTRAEGPARDQILGGVGGVASLGPRSAAHHRRPLAVRSSGSTDPHLFLTKFKLSIGPRSIENVVSQYLEKTDIRDASVHSLRHTFGTHTVKRGTQLWVVQEVLGHASLKTTSLYVQLAREDMDRQLQEHVL